MHRINIGVNVCVQNITLLELEDLYNFLQEELPNSNPVLQIVDGHADKLHPAAVTDEVFDQVEKSLAKYQFFENLLNSLREFRKEAFAGQTQSRAIEWLDLLEARRKTNWRQVLKIAQHT